jgi:hypothetical protein
MSKISVIITEKVILAHVHSSVYSTLQPPATSPLYSPSILLSTLF